MNEGPINTEPALPHAKLETREIEGYSYIAAEARSLRHSGVTRDHTRLIGIQDPAVSGHPLVYSDTYSGSRDDVYVYARHAVQQSAFFLQLDAFLEQLLTDFPELSGKPFLFSLQANGEFIDAELSLPLLQSLEIPADEIDFARLSLNIVDMAVEFTGTPFVSSDETMFTDKGLLRRKLESPLFGFDASRSDIWAPFLAEIHWASRSIPKHILSKLIRSAAAVIA